MTNQRTLSQRLRCVDPMDQWSSIEERCNLAADELDRLSRIEIKYDNLCPVLNELEAEIQRLQRALAFWLPHVPSSGSERATRCGDDARLLVGYAGRLDPDAEYLGWITF